jgi:hypothetical protein
LVFIDEVMLHQCMHKSAAAGDLDVHTRLPLQFGYFFRDITLGQPSIIPPTLFQAR